MTNGNESKHAYNLFFGSISPYHLRPLMYESSADYPLNLHDYQIELVQKALEGENTLICAPTGSGKTVVAAYIIREHIFELRKNLKIPKIIFVVPTVPLVEQQTNEFKRFLGHCATTIGLHGRSENLDFNSVISSVDIIVLTPQILVNATDPRFCKYEDINRISLDVFTLIILDEVHHTNKKHSYNGLMKEYHRCKYGDSNFPSRSMPQVVGLTASLGSPKRTENVEEVIKYIINKCANFDAISYTIVTKNTAELYSKIGKTKEYAIVVKNNDELVNAYYTYLESLIKSIEKYLMEIDGVLRNPEIFEGYCDMKKDEYKTWLSVTRSTTLRKAKLSPSSKMKATDCLNYLDLIYEAYQCAQLFPTEDTTKFYLKNLGSEDGTDLDQFVYRKKLQLGKDPCSESDIFKELIKCVNNQFIKNVNSKVIIFTSQRYYCKLGSEVIERYTGKTAAFISGANASSEEAGCNPSQQSQIVKKFRNGEIQILFATTVAEEGINIADCNLVITYNLVTNNIAHIQRKGRARQILSESILITFEEKKKILEEKNIENIKMINKAYEILEKIPSTRKLSMECEISILD
uniref:Uncharacterized protein n=1 Tax=Panagrolaimus davidi TaxID=227884 RepID=A0A914PBQ3_9BILA